MRAVVQRVKSACVSVRGNRVSEIGGGLLIYLGISNTDIEKDADYLLKKIFELRIFEDSNNKLNLNIIQEKKELMIVSQFTLYGDCRKGTRPSFTSAAIPDQARAMYCYFVNKASQEGSVKQGIFSEHMEVESVNDGPVTILLDSSKLF